MAQPPSAVRIARHSRGRLCHAKLAVAWRGPVTTMVGMCRTTVPLAAAILFLLRGDVPGQTALTGVRHNAHYIAPPGAGEGWKTWLDRLRTYREQTRSHFRDAGPAAFDDSIYRRDDLRLDDAELRLRIPIRLRPQLLGSREAAVSRRLPCATRPSGSSAATTRSSSGTPIRGSARTIATSSISSATCRAGWRACATPCASSTPRREGLPAVQPMGHRHARERQEPDDEALARLVAAVGGGRHLPGHDDRGSPGRLRQAVDAAAPGRGLRARRASVDRRDGAVQRLLGPGAFGLPRDRRVAPEVARAAAHAAPDPPLGQVAPGRAGRRLAQRQRHPGVGEHLRLLEPVERRATGRPCAAWPRCCEPSPPCSAEGEWLPYYPTLAEKVYASCWQRNGVRLWTIVNQSGRPVDGPILEVEDQRERFFDLWRGVPLEPGVARRQAPAAGMTLRSRYRARSRGRRHAVGTWSWRLSALLEKQRHERSASLSHR